MAPGGRSWRWRAWRRGARRRRNRRRITPAAASLGLEWYAEHTADALAFPGKHPNIDRLLAWAQGMDSYQVQSIAA